MTAMIVREAICDPADPFLDHHRPGGAPLLGTVMQLAILAEALGSVFPGAFTRVMRDIVIGPPLIFNDRLPHTVRIAMTPVSEGCWDARLTSGGDAVRIQHTAARFEFAASATGAASPVNGFDTARACADLPVAAADIYACYFHGPAFRVLAGAARIDNAVVSRAMASLPQLSAQQRSFSIAPRLIEFALQTAGLVHLALDCTMMIPLRIARITRHAVADIGDGEMYRACAVRQKSGPKSNGAVIDIAVANGEGAVVLEVAGYACAPLPFAHSHTASDALAAMLNADIFDPKFSKQGMINRENLP